MASASYRWLTAFFVCVSAFGGFGFAGRSWSQEAPASAEEQTVREEFEKVAAQLEFFDTGAFLYNRPQLSFTPEDRETEARYFQLLDPLLDPHLPAAEVAPLCHHADAKVRTLALAALFQRNDPHLLTQIVELTGDTNPTFPFYESGAQAWWPGKTRSTPPEEKKQSVGDVANALTKFYLREAGFHHGVAGSSSEPGFTAYWAQREARAYCASWFAVELARASRGVEPTQPPYHADIRAVRTRIDALPAADRDWTLLYLNGEAGSDVLASESELMAAAKRRGADALLSVLREKIPSDDPDLQGRHWSCRRLMGWILAKAPQLLLPAMADDLLECERWQRDSQVLDASGRFITAAWPVAAAQLQPQRGREILRAAWPRFDGRFDGNHRISLMAALAAVGDARDSEFLPGWYFAPSPGYDGSVNQGKPSEFFNRLPRWEASRGTRQIVARLINDHRFDNTRFWAVYEAARLVNTWSTTPVFDTPKLFEAGWIGGEDRPEASAAIAAARDTLRRTSAEWGQ